MPQSQRLLRNEPSWWFRFDAISRRELDGQVLEGENGAQPQQHVQPEDSIHLESIVEASEFQFDGIRLVAGDGDRVDSP